MKQERVEINRLIPGPIQHASLPDHVLTILRWTYAVVGRYLQPTLEQWELGFMRELDVQQEVLWWYRAAFAFCTYHRRRSLPLRSDAEERKLVGVLCGLTTGNPPDDPQEEAFLRECLANPDGWEDETARAIPLLPQGEWVPPTPRGGWPA